MLFADDANMYITNKNLPELFQDLEIGMTELSTWFRNNKLSLSLEKNQYTIFHPPRKKIPNTYDSILLNRTKIHKAHSVKYLGMIIDETLSWTEHINNLKNSLKKLASSFKIIKHFLPNKSKKNLYYAYAYSKIQYGIEVYGSGKLGPTKQIQILKNRILKTLYNKDWLTPTTLLHKELNLHMVKDIHNLQINKFVYKYLHNELPPPFMHYFTLNRDTHDHNTRNNKQIHIDSTHSVHTVKVIGARTYNNIPETIRESNTLNTFTAKLKTHLMKQY